MINTHENTTEEINPPKLSHGKEMQTTNTSSVLPGWISWRALQEMTSSTASRVMIQFLVEMDKTEYLVMQGMILFICRTKTRQVT